MRTESTGGAALVRALRVAVVGGLLALTGCGSAPSDSTAASATKAKAVTTASPSDLADMVSAVSPAGSAPPISMKFRLQARPLVGSPVQLTLALIPDPNAGVSSIHVSLQPGEGILMQSESDRTLRFDDLKDGNSLQQTVTLVPQQAGVLSLTATVVVELDSGSLARTFAVPLIAVPDAS